MGYDLRIVDDPTDLEVLRVSRKEFYAALAARDALPDEDRGRGTPEGPSERYRAAQARVDEAYVALCAADVGYFGMNMSGMSWARGRMIAGGMLTDDPEGPGIGVWKLCSNDGWHVTPDEITSALARLEEAEVTFDEEFDGAGAYWDRWVAWLTLAAEHEGFEVR